MTMSVNRKQVVLFYPTGIVHFRNLEILKTHLREFEFRVIVEPWVEKTAPEVLAGIEPGQRVMVGKEGVGNEMWQDVSLLFLSMAYPNLSRLGLVEAAVKRGIGVIGLEEVNQLALNEGIINHYFLPLDLLGVVSGVEKQRFLELGIKETGLMVTGWPFFNGEAWAQEESEGSIRDKYEIVAGKKIALVILGSLKEDDIVSLETNVVRETILEIITQGLPVNYQVVIKPHPLEKQESLARIAERFVGVKILGARERVEPVLLAADLVINRGNSQVILLAMQSGKPIIVVPVGLRTIFHGQLAGVIAGSSEEFSQVVSQYEHGQRWDYQELLKLHFPLTQEQALEQVKQMFVRGVREKQCTGDDKRVYMSILYAFLGALEPAIRILDEVSVGQPGLLLRKLYLGESAVEEFAQLLEWFPGLMVRWHLQALWVRRLSRSCQGLNLGEAVWWLDGFNGEVNPHYFIEELVQRVELEFRAGREEEAERLLARFSHEYGGLVYYRQAFAMFNFVYRGKGRFFGLRKLVWFLFHLHQSYTRKTIKVKWMGGR